MGTLIYGTTRNVIFILYEKIGAGQKIVLISDYALKILSSHMMEHFRHRVISDPAHGSSTFLKQWSVPDTSEENAVQYNSLLKESVFSYNLLSVKG